MSIAHVSSDDKSVQPSSPRKKPTLPCGCRNPRWRVNGWKPCGSSKCCRHCRSLWAWKSRLCVVRGLEGKQQPGYFVTILPSKGMTNVGFAKAVAKYLIAIRRPSRFPTLEYLRQFEWVGGIQHAHLLITADVVIPGVLRKCGKALGLRVTVQRIKTNVIGAIRYVLKDMSSKRAELTPKAFRGRVLTMSSGFLSGSLASLWADIQTDRRYKCQENKQENFETADASEDETETEAGIPITVYRGGFLAGCVGRKARTEGRKAGSSARGMRSVRPYSDDCLQRFRERPQVFRLRFRNASRLGGQLISSVRVRLKRKKGRTMGKYHFSGGAAAANDKFQAAADKFETAAQKFSESVDRAAKANSAASGNKPGKASAGGSAAGSTMSKVAAGVTAFGSAINAAAKAATLLSDTTQTTAQQMRGLAAEFIPFGKAVIDLSDAIDGTTSAMHKQAAAHEIATAAIKAESAARIKSGALSSELAGYSARASAQGKFSIAAYKSFDKSALGGERAAGIQDATAGAQNELVRAQREQLAAKITAQQSAAEANEKAQAVKRARTEADNATAHREALQRGEAGGVRNKAPIDKAIKDELQARERLTALAAEHEASATRAKERGLSAIQAEAQARAAAVNVAKAELSVLQQQEQRMVGMARSAGAMSKGERLSSIRALQMVKEHGIDNVPPEIANQAAKIGGDYIGKQREKSGADFIGKDVRGAFSDKDFKEIFADGKGGADFGKGSSLQNIQAAVTKATANVNVKIDLDTTEMAKKVTEMMGPIIGHLLNTVKIQLENQDKNVRVGMAQRNNAAN